MIAIETRYLPTTNTKPSRIVAETCNGQRLVVSRWKAEDMTGKGIKARDDDLLAVVAQALADKRKWPGRLVGGATKRGMCFVFVE